MKSTKSIVQELNKKLERNLISKETHPIYGLISEINIFYEPIKTNKNEKPKKTI